MIVCVCNRLNDQKIGAAIDWLQTQLRLIEQMGIKNFVQLQSKANATAGS